MDPIFMFMDLNPDLLFVSIDLFVYPCVNTIPITVLKHIGYTKRFTARRLKIIRSFRALTTTEL